jgi:hypothetical protein
VRFERLFDLAENKSSTVVEMFSSRWEVGGWGGLGVAAAVMGVGVGDGGECQTLLLNLYVSRLNLHICGRLILPTVTLFVMHIIFRLLKIQSFWVQLMILCGTNRFPWRFPYSHGVSCVTDCQQKQTWLLVSLYYQKLNFACQDVEATNRHNIYFSHATHLVLFGCWLGLGLTFRRWILKIFMITLFSILIQQVVFERDGPSCNLYSSPAFG